MEDENPLDRKLPVSRLAPSPTGWLHLGNAWAFLICWLAVRSAGGKLILRMDDIDPNRSKAEYAAAIIEDLQWLGLNWDIGPQTPGFIWSQSGRASFYSEGFAKLREKNLVYPCFCSRQDLRNMASAPHADDAAPVYSGKCRKLSNDEVKQLIADGRQYSMRLVCPKETVIFEDLILGRQEFSYAAYGGDFPIRRADGVWAYQLASAVDDGMMGINLVVRGRDLASSTPRQLIVMDYLGITHPDFAHIPLLLDDSGERLAKRHKSLSLGALREKGMTPERLIGFLARLAGINPGGHPCQPSELVSKFSFDKLPVHDLKIDVANEFTDAHFKI